MVEGFENNEDLPQAELNAEESGVEAGKRDGADDGTEKLSSQKSNWMVGSQPDSVVTPLDALRGHLNDTGNSPRVQQEEMVEIVSKIFLGDSHTQVGGENFSSGTWGFIEAGTGTGKSYAYLFPAAFLPGRYVVITSTKQLGEQLVKKDLPAIWGVAKQLGKEFDYAILKGRNNYVCKLKVSENEDLEQSSGQASPENSGEVGESETSKKVRALYEWINETESGDRSEGPPVSDKIWSSVSSTSQECLRKKCRFYESCFANEALQEAEQAKIVVTNHAYFAHKLKSLTGQDVEGSKSGFVENLIIDEAHDFLDSISQSYTETITPSYYVRVTKSFHETLPKEETYNTMLDTVVSACESFEDYLKTLNKGEKVTDQEGVRKHLMALYTSLQPLLAAHLDYSVKQNGEDSKRLIGGERLTHLSTTVDNFLDNVDNTSTVMWVEESDASIKLKLAHVDVSKFVAATLADTNMVATSATLTVGGRFDSIVESYGGKLNRSAVEQSAETLFLPPSVVTKNVGSVFEYKKQGLLYVPAGFPEPIGKDRTEHGVAVLEELRDLVDAIGGRTLALFTTAREAQSAADHLRMNFPHLNILKHGDEDTGSLVKKFVEDETSVLCGTMGLWQGVDAPGSTCSLVFINKIPFPPPTDVLSQAKMERAKSEGRNGFAEVVVPYAATVLAQAAGRLIRSVEDRGVVAITDPRLLTKSYGNKLRNSLPNFNLYTDKETVVGALRRLEESLPPPSSAPRKASPDGDSLLKNFNENTSLTLVERKRKPVKKTQIKKRYP